MSRALRTFIHKNLNWASQWKIITKQIKKSCKRQKERRQKNNNNNKKETNTYTPLIKYKTKKKRFSFNWKRKGGARKELLVHFMHAIQYWVSAKWVLNSCINHR